MCRHPRLLDAIEECIGHDIVLVFSSFFIKPADGKDSDGNDALVSWSVLSTELFLPAAAFLRLPTAIERQLTARRACAGIKTTSALAR